MVINIDRLYMKLSIEMERRRQKIEETVNNSQRHLIRCHMGKGCVHGIKGNWGDILSGYPFTEYGYPVQLLSILE